MTRAKSTKADIYRLGIEMQARNIVPWEHPDFGGVNAEWHIEDSKHLDGRAVDLNAYPASREPVAFDALSDELLDRGFDLIWQRNRPQVDHTHHAHVETRDGNPGQYPGRVNRATSHKRPTLSGVVLDGTRYLVVDGKPGPKTITRFQQWLGTPIDGVLNTRKSPAIRALQAFLNTENRGTLSLDGTVGIATASAMTAYLGWNPTDHDYLTAGHWREIQRRLNEDGYL